MKQFFIPLLTLFLSCSSFVCGSPLEANITPIVRCPRTTILTIDKNSPYRNEVIQDLLSLQKSLIISLQEPIPKEFAQTGFLLVPMTPEYVSQLLEQKDGHIICAYQNQTLIGYVLLTDVSEFKELYQDENIGCFETSIDDVTLKLWLAGEGVGYIEQIAVKPGYSRMGVGSALRGCEKIVTQPLLRNSWPFFCLVPSDNSTRVALGPIQKKCRRISSKSVDVPIFSQPLIADSKNMKPQGLIADVFIHPIKNEPSLNFFSHQSFSKSGILHQYPTANTNFPYAHRTQVFFWNRT